MNTQNHKVVIITGANSGIGKTAALKFATEGYTVVMACRNRQKSQRVQEEISRLSNNTNIEVMTLDVSSMASITAFCQEFRNKYQKLDILIHNAASFNFGTKQYQFSRDGIELTFATNTFGPLLMNVLLQDLLKKAENPKILNASTININWFH